MLERELEVASLTIRMAEIVLDVGIASVAERGGGERPDRARPVLHRHGRLPRRIVRVYRLLGRRFAGIATRHHQHERGGEAEQRARPLETPITCSLSRQGQGASR